MKPAFRIDALAAPAFVVVWSSGFIGAKYGLPYIEPATLLALRFGFATLLIGLWIVVARAPWPTPRQARDAAVVGILLQVVYLGGVYQAIELGTEAWVSALIVALHPVLTAMISRQSLGERLEPVQWVGIAFGFLGVGLVVARKLDAGVGDWRGVVLCLCALGAISVASILQKARAGDHPMRSTTMVQFVTGLVVLTPVSFAFETQEIAWSVELVLTLVWLVVVMSIGALSLLLFLIRRGAASSVASLFFLVPPTTALMAWAIFGEGLSPAELAGIAATALGVLMVNRPGLFAPGLSRG